MAGNVLRDLADGVKRLSEIKQELSELDFKERIIELRELLNSAREEILELGEVNSKLKIMLADLQRKFERKTSLAKSMVSNTKLKVVSR